MRAYYLNEDKTYRPANLMEWSEQLQRLAKANTRHVGKDIIHGHMVSTVWLGLDHNWFGGKPLVFETMVFEGDKPGRDIYMNRYTTWQEAEEGHQKAIVWVKSGCGKLCLPAPAQIDS